MSLDLQQTDQGAAAISGCSGLPLAYSVGGTKLVNNGTPGINEQRMYIRANSLEAAYFMRTEAGDLPLIWDAGIWTVRLNIVDPDRDISLEEVWICRFNSNFQNQGTVGKTQNIGKSLDKAKVISINVTGTEQNAMAGDMAYVICGFKNKKKKQMQHFGILPNQIINTPIEV